LSRQRAVILWKCKERLLLMGKCICTRPTRDIDHNALQHANLLELLALLWGGLWVVIASLYFPLSFLHKDLTCRSQRTIGVCLTAPFSIHSIHTSVPLVATNPCGCRVIINRELQSITCWRNCEGLC
jgi:hypothetical protein